MITNTDEWINHLETLQFDEYSKEIASKILEGIPDEYSKQFFIDSYEYVYNCYKQNKPLEANLFKIYLEDIKGYKNIKLEEFLRMTFLLSYCGFNITEN